MVDKKITVDLADLEAEIGTPDSVSLNSEIAEKNGTAPLKDKKLDSVPEPSAAVGEKRGKAIIPERRSMKLMTSVLREEAPSKKRTQPSTSEGRKGLTGKEAMCRLLWISAAVIDCLTDLFFCQSMANAAGMDGWAVATLAIAGICCILGYGAEMFPYRKSAKGQPSPIYPMLACYLADLPRILLVLAIVRRAPNCAYALSMSQCGSAASLMIIGTLFGSAKRCMHTAMIGGHRAEKDRRRSLIAVGANTIGVLPSMFAAFIYLFILHNTKGVAEWNKDCSLSPSVIRISTTSVYPIVNCVNGNEPAEHQRSVITSYRMESAIEFKFKVADLFVDDQSSRSSSCKDRPNCDAKRPLLFTTDCRRLPAFETLMSATPDEQCTVAVSLSLDANDGWEPEYEIEIKLHRQDGYERSAQLCRMWNGRAGKPMNGSYISSGHLEQVVGGYCGFRSNVSVRECPAISSSDNGGRKPMACLDCSQSCYGRSAINRSGPIGFDGVGGRMSIGGRMYTLQYRKHDSCDRDWGVE